MTAWKSSLVTSCSLTPEAAGAASVATSEAEAEAAGGHPVGGGGQGRGSRQHAAAGRRHVPDGARLPIGGADERWRPSSLLVCHPQSLLLPVAVGRFVAESRLWLRPALNSCILASSASREEARAASGERRALLRAAGRAAAWHSGLQAKGDTAASDEQRDA